MYCIMRWEEMKQMNNERYIIKEPWYKKYARTGSTILSVAGALRVLYDRHSGFPERTEPDVDRKSLLGNDYYDYGYAYCNPDRWN